MFNNNLSRRDTLGCQEAATATLNVAIINRITRKKCIDLTCCYRPIAAPPPAAAAVASLRQFAAWQPARSQRAGDLRQFRVQFLFNCRSNDRD